MKKGLVITLIATIMAVFTGCKSGKDTANSGSDSGEISVKLPPMTGHQLMNPDATIFKMSGDYANNVAVGLNADGSLSYYPAPTDLSKESAPYELGNGWYLHRQGIGPNAVFTRWTFSEYMALPQAPSREEIKSAIIPGARVTEMETIPLSLDEALSDPVLCIKFAK